MWDECYNENERPLRYRTRCATSQLMSPRSTRICHWSIRAKTVSKQRFQSVMLIGTDHSRNIPHKERNIMSAPSSADSSAQGIERVLARERLRFCMPFCLRCDVSARRRAKLEFWGFTKPGGSRITAHSCKGTSAVSAISLNGVSKSSESLPALAISRVSHVLTVPMSVPRGRR